MAGTALAAGVEAEAELGVSGGAVAGESCVRSKSAKTDESK